MRVLVVSLALTVFAGSQGFVLRDESPSRLSQLEKKLQDDMVTLWRSIYKKICPAEKSERGEVLCNWENIVLEAGADRTMRPLITTRLWHDLREINRTCIEQSAANTSSIDARSPAVCALVRLGLRIGALLNASPPEVEDLANQIAITLRDGAVMSFVTIYALDAKTFDESWAFHRALEQDLDPILEKLEPYIRFLQQDLELNEKLDKMVRWSVQRLQPLATEIPRKIQEIQGSFDPIVDEAQKVIVTGVENSRDALQRVASRMLVVLRKYGELLNQ